MCEHCGKHLFPNRKVARRAARRMRPEGGRLSAYRCPVLDGFHLGHLPAGGRDVAREIRFGRAS